ncbi:MAG TPA: patatin-like phospholipase family protein [Pseudomonas sp.]|jgi:NTE family protein
MSDLIVSGVQLDFKHPRNGAAKQKDNDFSAEAEKMSVEKRPIFLALQGGGARGIVHVGALTAINELDLDIRGVSGTSAGSIVAALIAVGYTGRDLLDPDLSKPQHLFDRMPPTTRAKKPTDLFSGAGWRWLRLIRWLTTLRLPKLFKVFGLSLVGGFAYLSYLLTDFNIYLGLSVNLVLAVVAFVAVGHVSNGLTTLDHVRDFMDTALKHKLGWPVETKLGGSQLEVTFSDLRSAGKIPLKIIATNTSNESVELFCADNTPDVAVADAVAASICLPIIFKPWQITFKRPRDKESAVYKFLDGGFVSNLPAWPFDEERLVQPEIPTIAMSILTPGAESKHWTSSIINTMVNGTAEIDTRAVGRFAKIPLPTDWGMLDFDKGFKDVYIEALRAKQVTLGQLANELIDTPKALREAANAILMDVTDIISQYAGYLQSATDLNGKVRVAIAAQRSSTPRLLSLISTSGYSYDVGFGAVLSNSHPSWAAWTENQPRMTRLDSSRKEFLGHSPQALWVLCVPLRPSQPSRGVPIKACVVMIEFDLALNNNALDGREHLVDIGACVSKIVSDYNESEGIANFVQGSNTCI